MDRIGILEAHRIRLIADPNDGFEAPEQGASLFARSVDAYLRFKRPDA